MRRLLTVLPSTLVVLRISRGVIVARSSQQGCWPRTSGPLWSMTPQTRSELQPGQPYPSKSSQTGEIVENPDGPIDRCVGPDVPEGLESN